MGNCLLVLQQNVVRVTKTDGKILEYKSPIKVDQVLSQFSNHAISDKLPVVKYMNPNDELRRNHSYYLLPLPVPQVKPKKKKNNNKRVRFSDEVVKDEEAIKQESGVVRIKLMISKQELQEILRVSADDMISQAQKENQISEGWLRSLEIVQEVRTS